MREKSCRAWLDLKSPGLPEAESRVLHTRVRSCKGETAESWGKDVSVMCEMSLPCATDPLSAHGNATTHLGEQQEIA